MTDRLERADRIWVAGHTGLAGQAMVRRLRATGHERLVLRTHAELDLVDRAAVRSFLATERPDTVFLCAAKVGGILANDTYPADFIRENLLIQTNVIDEAFRSGVRRLLFLGSSCIYPRDCPQPIKEEYLLTGPLERTNRAYAVAKLAGVETCWAYDRQHGTDYVCAMPTNLYGPGDDYDLASSHVLPALIRRMHEAKARGEGAVTLWGSGEPRRELLHSDDLADACILLMSLPRARRAALLPPDAPPIVNVGSGRELTIRELARVVAEVVGFGGELRWDRTRPDGTPRKLLDTSKLAALGFVPRVELRDGIAAAYRDFLARG